MPDPHDEPQQKADDELDPNAADAQPIEDEFVLGDPNAPQPKNAGIPDDAR